MLGKKATNIINGLSGVITATAEFLHGPQRIELTPDTVGKDGKPLKGCWLYPQEVKLGKTKIKVNLPVPTVMLGTEVTDSLTGFKGVATGRFTFINGCIQVEVTSKTLKDGKPIEGVGFDEQRLTKQSNATKGGPCDGPPPYSRP